MKTRILRQTLVFLTLGGLGSSSAAAELAAQEEPAGLPTITDRTRGLDRHEGFLTYHLEPATGEILLEVRNLDDPLVSCDLTVRSYGTEGTCVTDATAQPGPRKQLAFIWPADTVDIFVSARPSSDPPWRGVLLANEFLVPFEIDSEQPDTPHERLVLRTGWSWVVVHEWREIGLGGGGPFGRVTASLVFGLVDYPPAGPDDVAILEMALARLLTLPTWDREDDRNCANDPPGQASLFCVLASAVRERMGQYHHRQPALEIVREVVNQRWPDRFENHRLMDFNNHPSTTLDDVRAVLEEALTLATDEAGQSG